MSKHIYLCPWDSFAGESHGERSLAGYSSWGCTESDMTEWLTHLSKQRHHFADKSLCSQSYGFSSSRVQIWELDYREGWVPKKWGFWIVVLEKTLQSSLDCEEIKPVNPKGNQPRILIGRTDAEAEAPILWPSDVKNWLIGKDPDSGKDWRQKERGEAEDKMIR